jgi:type IV secretion system protein VirD4
MYKLPPLPRHDPDATPSGNPPLATSQWMSYKKTIECLSYDIKWEKSDAINPILLGQIHSADGKRHFIGFDDDRHIITVAGSRAGKGDGMIIPNLLTYRGSVICIDPKGENASVTAAWRAKKLGQEVYVLDPFNVAKIPDKLRATFNPLDSFDVNDPEVMEDVAALAEAMIVSGDEKDAHWDETARSFIKGTILWLLASDGECSTRCFELLRKSLTLGRQAEDESYSFKELLEIMQRTGTFNGVIAASASTLSQMGDNERGSVLSTVRRNTEFLESISIINNLQSSSLNLSNLKQSQKGVTIYLVLPEWRFATHSRWLRMLITVFLQALQRTPKGWNQQKNKPLPSVLLILEEFAALGRMPMIEKAAGYIAGFGVKIWTVLQDLNQLSAHYEKTWETFIGNAGVLTAFGNVDVTTLEYLSKRLGQTEVSRITGNYSNQKSGGDSRSGLGRILGGIFEPKAQHSMGAESIQNSWNESSSYGQQLHTIPLLQPDEVGRYFGRRERNDTAMLLTLIAGALPIRLELIRSGDDPFFQKRASPNPFHGIAR